MKKRIIKVTNITYIAPLQIDGPIVNPISVSEKTVKELVRKGYTVIEKVDGQDVVLNALNVNDPKGYLQNVENKKIADEKAAIETHTKQVVHERVFTKQTPINTAPPVKKEDEPPAPPKPKTSIEQEYDFGNDVEVVNTVIEPEPEIAGRLFTGRPMPDISENIETIAEVDTSTEGHVEDIKPVETNNTINGGNRLQKKRKHKK